MAVFKFNGVSYWKLIGGLRACWQNSVGGWHHVGNDLDDLEFYEADSHADFAVEQKARDLLEEVLVENFVEGWIDPEGQFYPCRYGSHTDVILGLGKGYEFEQESWIHLSAKCWYAMNPSADTTDAQKETLLKLGRTPDDFSERNENLEYEDVFPQGNPAVIELVQKCEEIIRTEQGKRKRLSFSSRDELLKYGF